MTELLQQFLSEAGDLLEQVDAGLLALERDPSDRALLDEVFRAAHTLKGSSGLFELPQLTRLTHAAEDLLDGVRGGRFALTAEMADDLLASFDLIRRWLEVVGRTGALPGDATAEGAALTVRLRLPLGGEAPAADASPGAGESALRPSSAPAPDWVLAGLGHDRVERVRAWLEHAETRCRILRFVPAEQCFFGGDDPLHLIAQIPAIEELVLEPREDWPALDEFDEYRCLLVFTVVTRATSSELQHLFRYVPEEFALVEVDAPALSALLSPAPEEPVPGDGSSGEGVSEAGSPDLAREVLTAQLRLLRAHHPTGLVPGMIAAAALVARSALSVAGRADEHAEEVLARAQAGGGGEELAALLEDELVATRTSGREPGDQAGPEEPVVALGRTGADPVATALDPAGERRPAAGRTLKVDQISVDRLLDLVGELVVAKNGLPFLAVAAEQDWNARALGRQIKDQYGVIHRVVEELQAAVMDIRMLPVAVLFARFPRMVRDLSRSLGKDVRLEQVGQDTAADKDIIEMLGDPMVHLVRNSLDHGIETPAQRVEAGKPSKATVRLRAEQEPDAVVIDITDDGRGVDPELIKRKAYERGLITEEQTLTLTDQEAVNLIFLAGFSTAETISDVSGRGVEMDAVRASIEAVGGSVRMSSTPGQGSAVRLRVPLSMAVSRVMIVTVGGQRFGVPVDLVIETVRVPPERVERVQHQEVIVLRDAVIPLVDLAGTFQLPVDRADEELVSVLVVRPSGEDVGLVVDAFQGGAEVIVKPMNGIVGGSREFCGTALMGDGSVLLVIDLKEVLADARPE